MWLPPTKWKADNYIVICLGKSDVHTQNSHQVNTFLIKYLPVGNMWIRFTVTMLCHFFFFLVKLRYTSKKIEITCHCSLPPQLPWMFAQKQRQFYWKDWKQRAAKSACHPLEKCDMPVPWEGATSTHGASCSEPRLLIQILTSCGFLLCES